jgi:hypothetical protein
LAPRSSAGREQSLVREAGVSGPGPLRNRATVAAVCGENSDDTGRRNGFDCYIQYFTELWSLLSPDGITENRASRDLALHRNPRIPPKASELIPEPTRFRLSERLSGKPADVVISPVIPTALGLTFAQSRSVIEVIARAFVRRHETSVEQASGRSSDRMVLFWRCPMG